MTRFFYILFCTLCVLVLFQDFIGIFLFNIGVPKYLLQLFLSLKDLIVVLMAILGLMTHAAMRRRIPFNATAFFFAGYTLTVTVYFVAFGGLNNIPNNINDLRSLIFPVYAYLAGYVMQSIDREDMIKFIEKAALFSVILSLGLYFLGDKALVQLRVLDYTEDVRGYFGQIYKGLPSSYYSKLSDMTIFRLAGPVFNSIGTATLYTFLAGLLIACYKFAEKSAKRHILLALIVLAIILTFSRGAILGFLLGLLVTDLLWIKPANSKKSIVAIYLIVILFIMVYYRNIANMIRETIQLSDPSTMSHYNGIVASLEYLKNNWIGRGVGSIGMWRFSDYTGGAGENSIVLIIGQVGAFAFIFLMGAYFCVVKKLIKYRDSYLNYGLLICAIAILFNSLFSSCLLVVTPLILFWFFVGYSEGSNRFSKQARVGVDNL